MKVRNASRKSEIKESLDIARSLKAWFTKEAIKSMSIDFNINKLFIAVDNYNVAGFLCYSSKHGTVKILWMGVKREYWRKGIGSLLIRKLVIEVKKLGVKVIRVETLTDQDTYEPYKITRDFYKKNGFIKIYTKKAIKKGWDDQDVMEKKI